MKVAILGGSFDPVHVGHLFIATEIKERFHFDEIWFMPCFQHPFNKKLTQADKRLKMLQTLDLQFTKISQFEIKKKEYSYTIDTLDELAKNHPDMSFTWIIGSDQIDDFPKWKNWKDIIAKYRLIIYPRDIMFPELEKKVKKTFGAPTIPDNILLIDAKSVFMTNLSSTMIRDRVKEQRSITFAVPEEVEKYIIENRLYLD